MLRRDRYRGLIIWGKHEKTYKGGTKVRVPWSRDEWTTLEVPALRIVDDDFDASSCPPIFLGQTSHILQSWVQGAYECSSRTNRTL